MKELRIEQISKQVGTKQLFEDLSLLVHEKDRIGLIGLNGTGKSSLLKVLAGIDSPDKGSLVHPNDYRVTYLAQDSVYTEPQTVLETIFTGNDPRIAAVKAYEKALSLLETGRSDAAAQSAYSQAEEQMNKQDAWQLDTQAKIMLTKLGIPQLEANVTDLSGGQQKRVALAQALLTDSDLLLLDEPTNHLDFEAITWLESFLHQYSGAVLFITHDRYFLDAVSSRIVELQQGRLLEYPGNYQEYLSQKAQRESEEATRLGKQKQLFKQELAWMRQGIKARGTRQDARVSRFQELKADLHQQPAAQQQVEIDVATQRLGKKVFRLEQASFKRGDLVILDHLDLLIQARDRIGIAGENGVGKSTFLDLLAQKIPLDSGVLEVGETVRLAYYTQKNEQLDGSKRMIEYLQEIAEEVETSQKEKISVTEMLERFLFPRSVHGTMIQNLSGGEKRRLYLLQLLIQQPNVLFLDEPTNDLDIDTLTILEHYFASFQGAIITVSHDRYFLDKTIEKLLAFEGDGKIRLYYGSMTDYLAEQKEQSLIEPVKGNEQPQKDVLETTKEPAKTKTKLTYAEQQEWTTIEAKIEKLENELATYQKEMTTQGSNFSELQRLQTAVETTEAELQAAYDRWEYLSTYAT